MVSWAKKALFLGENGRMRLFSTAIVGTLRAHPINGKERWAATMYLTLPRFTQLRRI